MDITSLELVGKSEDHLTEIEQSPFKIHKLVKNDFENLKLSAKKAGFDLSIVSSFRDYEQQKRIWNNKASGNRVLLDDSGIPMDYDKLSPDQVLKAILRWSAIPGASRHHWGTDIDVYDVNSLPNEEYEVELTPQEVSDDGIFGKFHQWLDKQIENNSSFNFFRPYAKDLGGVSPERWHISHRIISNEFNKRFSFEVFTNLINESDILLKDFILKDAEKIFDTYIKNISS